MDNKALSLKGSFLLLLLLSNLLLCVDSLPICPSEAVNCKLSLRYMFDRAIILSHYIHTLSTEMFREFVKQFVRDEQQFIARAMNSCHTASIPTPTNKEEAQSMHHEALLSLVLVLLRSWNDPLYHLVMEVRGMQGPQRDILSKAVEIEERNKQLLEGVERMVGQVFPGVKENQTLPVWPGFPSPQAANEDIRLSAFYTLLHCLRRDSNKVDSFLKLLKCRIVYDNNC